MTLSNLIASLSRRKLLIESSVNSCDFLWSKNYAFYCDGNVWNKHVFDSTERLLTRNQWQVCYNPRGAIFWVKLGSYRNGRPNNLHGFVANIMPKISRPFTLITTDGDSSVPHDLSKEVVSELLNNKKLVAWYSQNLECQFHPKLRPIPIGLDFHTDRGFGTGIKLQRIFRSIATEPSQPRINRALVDFSESANSEMRRAFIAANRSNDLVEIVSRRIPQLELWKMYRRYRWVVSLPGNGLDCHRTWEAGYLGASVLVARGVLPMLHDQKFITQINPDIRLKRSDLGEVGGCSSSCDQIVSDLHRRFIVPIKNAQCCA